MDAAGRGGESAWPNRRCRWSDVSNGWLVVAGATDTCRMFAVGWKTTPKVLAMSESPMYSELDKRPFLLPNRRLLETGTHRKRMSVAVRDNT